MKKILVIIGLIFSLFTTLLLLSHYFPEKVPKSVATAIPEEEYKKIPRQVREYFPWIKPKQPEKPFTYNLQELNREIDEYRAQQEQEQQKAPQKPEESLQQVIEEFYQKLAENQFDQAFDLLHPVSQNSLSGDNFVNYYTLIKDSIEINKVTVDPQLVAVAEFKDPVTKAIVKPLTKARVTMEIINNFSVTKSISETIYQDVYFSQNNGQWKIVEVDINNDNFKEKKFYYFIDEGYKRLSHKDYFGAIEYFRKAIKINKLSINANYGLSVALFSIAYYDKAIETVQKMESIYRKKYISKLAVDTIDLKTIKELDVERLSNGYYIMASALIKKGNQAGAKDALYKALALNPKNNYALALIKTIPRNVAAKPSPYLYKEESTKEDPFQKFKENAGRETPQSQIMAIDPEEGLSMLQNR